MGDWRKYIPDGTRDILFKECSVKVEVENKLRTVYKRGGYSELVSPTLEFYDVFNLENQPIEQEKMYKLFDNKGRIMVLRPDMTTPIARIVSTKIKNDIYPVKLCYTSNIFRVNENLNGKLSEITQSGIEIVGTDSIKADAEAVITAIKALKAIGLKNFKIEIGQAEFFKAIMEDVDINPDEKEKIRKCIENKNFAALREILALKEAEIGEEKAKMLNKLPELFGGMEVLETAKGLTKNAKALETLNSVEELYEIIKCVGLQEYLTIDLGMVQHINYYTGLIFRGYSTEVGDDILTGGRYDRLMEQFGKKMPATGLALNVDNILIAMERQYIASEETHPEEYVIYADKAHLKEAYALLTDMENEGKSAEISVLDSEEETRKYAQSRNKKLIVCNN
ncbi:MAG: ATP phosphoribosyltransferase regulatory subunit [Bacillota bacterium]|nr:ATP phosphoribosyltransferase regulatory subunit [Bacillota bacterium]